MAGFAEPMTALLDPTHKTGQIGLAKVKYGHLWPSRPKPRPMSGDITSPAPRTVMAAERAGLAQQALKKRKYATVMGGGYGSLSVTTERLGT